MIPDISTMLTEAEAWLARTKAKAPTGKPWYEVENATSDKAVLRIYDEISMSGVDAESFAGQLRGVTASTIEVQINSPGGSVFDGLAIFNALRTHPARVVTRVDGIAASAASFIAQAGDERVMVQNSQMMVHNAHALVIGNADVLRDAAAFLEKQSANMAALYASRSDSHDADHYQALMDAETWMTAEEAVDEGLADSVLYPERQKAPEAKISPPAATDAAATAAADVAATAELSHGERAAFLRTSKLPQRNT